MNAHLNCYVTLLNYIFQNLFRPYFLC